MTDIIERAARAVHKDYCAERLRKGVKPSELPQWEDLGEDGIYYFTARVKTVLRAIREPDGQMIDAGADALGKEGLDVEAHDCRLTFRAMIDAALGEQT